MYKISAEKKLMVTSPLKTPLDEFIPYLEKIWESRQLTNGGEFHSQLEKSLCEFLGVKYLSLTANGTLALLLAIRSMDLSGEVITTPFTHISTAQAIKWNNLTPVFVDIDPSTLNIDVLKIERAITEMTSAIIPVHVFGNPCEIEKIQKLADKYKLKVIYDAAHCFGVEYKGQSICNYGLSVLSFHATKVYNCIEGGAVITDDKATKDYIDALRNSGIDSNNQLIGFGLNAKMNEVQAAYGLLQLGHVHEAIEARKRAVEVYRQAFAGMDGITFQKEHDFIKSNYSYFPVIIDKTKFGHSRDEIVSFLESRQVFPKKYFYPLVSDYSLFQELQHDALKNAKVVSENIICLPLSHEISEMEVKSVVSLFSELHASMVHFFTI